MAESRCIGTTPFLKEIGSLPPVGDIRGRGLFWTIEFVLDKKTKTALSPRYNFCSKVMTDARGMGLNLLGNLGHTGEYHVDHVLVCPPYTTTDAKLEEIVSLLRAAILKTSELFVHEEQLKQIWKNTVITKVTEIGLVATTSK
ncbi:hypothetical protein AbraIFM66950_005538 [Aspergillus brasiliensis]|nr:hypothetical protein AbraIFM66950_005538 [Aspergillus brasiliensis]